MFIAIILSLTQVALPSDTLHLSLLAAVERAHEFNPTLRAERAEARMAAQGPLDASRAFLPTLTLGIQNVRTTDPVAVFGLKLRQENFATEDLALDALNRPNAYTGYSSSATVELPIFAPEGLFGYTAARRAAAAREAATERAAGATTFFVKQAYWSAQLAARQTEALATALEAARSHVAQAEALHLRTLMKSSYWLDCTFTPTRRLFSMMRSGRVGGSLMAALAVGLLVMPYAKPLACGLTDHGAVASHHPGDVGDKSSDGSDDGGECHDSLTCNLANVAPMPPEGREALMPPVCHRQENRPHEFISANLQPPLTPPPRV